MQQTEDRATEIGPGVRRSRRVRGPELYEARDPDLLRWIGRYGVVSPQQVARRWFGTQEAANRRLRKLEQLGLVRRDRTFWHAPYAVRLTGAGVRLAGVDVPPAKLSLAELRHSLAVVDLVEDLIRQYPQAELHTDRELRVQRGRERRAGTRKEGRGRTPDGLLTFPDGRTLAIELDLSPKATSDYERAVRAYEQERFTRVWWYVPSLEARERLVAVVAKLRADDLIEVRVWVP